MENIQALLISFDEYERLGKIDFGKRLVFDRFDVRKNWHAREVNLRSLTSGNVDVRKYRNLGTVNECSRFGVRKS